MIVHQNTRFITFSLGVPKKKNLPPPPPPPKTQIVPATVEMETNNNNNIKKYKLEKINSKYYLQVEN